MTASAEPTAHPTASTAVTLGVGPLTIEDVVAVARSGAEVRIADTAWDRIAASRAIIEALADDTEPHYGCLLYTSDAADE